MNRKPRNRTGSAKRQPSRRKGRKTPTSSNQKRNLRTPSPSKRNKKPTRRLASYRNIIRGGAILSLLLFIFIYIECKDIDKRVVVRLRSERSTAVPAIYSAPFNLSAFIIRQQGRSLDARNTEITSALRNRKYVDSLQPPDRAGEFRIEGNELIIRTRKFQDIYGNTVPARLKTIDLTEAHDAEQIYIEPQPVSFMGSGNIRASSNVSLEQIPLFAQRAVLAIEDERFYHHFGIDIISIARAIVANVASASFAQGGSTLTQQLAKNMFLSPKKTLLRKIQEIPTALSIERHLSKKQILELYLNEVYLGQEGSVAIHGFPAAAKSFFGKNVEELELHEAALLAGIIKAPSYYNPRRSSKRAKTRGDLVLSKMSELGFITPAELKNATTQPISILAPTHRNKIAPFFSAAVENDLSAQLDLQNTSSTGLNVMTGLDTDLQRCASQAISRELSKLERGKPSSRRGKNRLQVALVAIEPFSGLVKAWIGGRNFSESQFDRVIQASRQIGSTIKPFVYLTALDGSLNSYKVATASSIIEDEPITFNLENRKTWKPENYDHNYRGDVTLRYALERSLNLPTLYIAQRVGIPAIRRVVLNFSLADSIAALPSLALGALDTNLLRLTSAYAALANGGIYVTPRLYTLVTDEGGEQLVTPGVSEQRVANEGPTYVLTNILQGVIERGTATSIRRNGFDGHAAGKTGTSDEGRDAWFIGYTPNLAVGVWVGFDDNTPTGFTGGSAAAPIWAAFMSCSENYVDNDTFIPPRTVEFLDIDTSTGALATENCPSNQVSREVFVQGSAPRSCPSHPPAYKASNAANTSSESFWSRFLP